MSTTDAHGPDAAATATETHDEPHESAGHGASGGHGDQHTGEEPLGPIDVRMWALGVLGVVLGGIVAVLMAMSVGVL